MAYTVVAPKFVWSGYPGLRAGRLYSGKPDLFKRPQGEAHLVDGPDAAQTLCGQSRALFPHEFPELGALGCTQYSTPCATCESIGAS